MSYLGTLNPRGIHNFYPVNGGTKVEKVKRTPKVGFFEGEQLPLKLDLRFFAESGGGTESNLDSQGDIDLGQQQDLGTNTQPATPADNISSTNQNKPRENLFTQEDVNNI